MGVARMARSEEKKTEFAIYLSKVFKPNSREIILEEKNTLLSDIILMLV